MPTLRRSIGTCGHVGVVEKDPPAGVGRFEPSRHAQQRGLAAAGGAEQHHSLATRDIKRYRLQRAGAVAERLAASGDPHGDAVMLVLPAAHLRTPPASPQVANICIAISSGMIMTKNTSVYADATSSRIEA